MFLHIGQPHQISELLLHQLNYDATKRNTIPIAVIDDEEFRYEESLRNHDFNLRVFKDIEDIKAVQPYAVILCDIKGVGKSFHSKFEGAHIISEIKKYYPAKIVIAYSAHQFDPSYNKYFEMSDYLFKKDIDSDDWVEKLDEALKGAINPIYQWKKIRNYLLENEISLFQILKLEDEYVKTVLSKGRHQFPSQKLTGTLPKDIKTVVLNFTSSLIFKVIIG